MKASPTKSPTPNFYAATLLAFAFVFSASAQTPIVQINSGGPATGTFAADSNFSGGYTFSTNSAITGATEAPAALYQKERWGNLVYTISGLTPGKTYEVKLHFAEIYVNGAGQRQFDVAINGTLVLDNYDIFAQSGGKFTAIVESFPIAADSSGNIAIQLIKQIENPKISGLEILIPGSNPDPDPDPQPDPDPDPDPQPDPDPDPMPDPDPDPMPDPEDYVIKTATPEGLGGSGAMEPFLNGALPTKTPSVVTDSGSWSVVEAFPNLPAFHLPLDLSRVPNTDPPMFAIREREGKIFLFEDSPTVSTKTEFINIADRLSLNHNGGLRGLIFHPEFNQAGSPNKDYFYVYYSASLNGNIYMTLSRFSRDPATGLGDPNSELVMIRQKEITPLDHIGGGLNFDKDGFLIIGFGDLEWTDEEYLDCLRIDRMFQGVILRLDVDMDPSRSFPPTRTLQGGLVNGIQTSKSLTTGRYADAANVSGIGYYIPNDNPFLNVPDNLGEHYAVGARNPWRTHLDRLTGNMYFFDVGSNVSPKYEEINFLKKGADYGWPYWEGPSSATFETGITQPANPLGTFTTDIWFYEHGGNGNSIADGVVYRGSKLPGLEGKMVYTDYSSGKIWALNFQNGARENELVHDWDGGFTGYENSHDEQEIYMTNYNKGKIYKLANSSQVNPEPPTLLSQTGAFTDLETLTPAAGLIPYAPAAPLWSDRAVKRRWVAIPNDGTHNTLTEKIVFSEEGEWDFPEGSVFIKHFEMPSKADPSKVVRLETRFLVRGYDGYYGFTYKWNLAGTDAVLQTGGSSEVIPVEQADGSPGAQDWNYPSRSQCMECHQSAAGRVLGLKTRQVNWDFNYQAAGTQNQLSYLDSLNIFHVALNSSNFGSYTTSKGIKDTSATEQHRIRSYLDSNCSNCHRPGGVAGRAQFDARLTTPFALAGIVGAAPSAETLGLTDPQLVKPGDYQNSLIYHRDSVRGEDAQMPPLGTNITDPDYLALLENWISQLSPDDVDSGAARGLNGSYYSGLNFQQLVMERVDPVVDFNWGGGAPSTQMPTNDFSVRWTGYIKIPETGTYTFYTTTDDGVRLWLDGMQVINDWTNHPAKEFSGSLVLLKDQIVPVTMEYFESGGEAVAKLEWSGPGISRTVIPNEQLQTELTDSQDPDPDPDPNPNPDPDPDPDPQPDPDLPPLAGPSEGVPAYNGSWQLLPSADGTKPVERHEGDYLAISNKLYLLGGRGTKPVQTYDASTNTWTNQSAAPFQIHHFQAVEWGGKIYIVGAFTGNYPDEDPVPNVYIYDPANDTWTQGPEIPVDRRRGATAAVVYNDKIYVIAGNTKGHQNGWVSWFDEFDPATGQWTSLPDAPRPRDHHRAVLFEDKLYVVAGRRSNDPIQNVKANTIVEIDVYDFATGEWSTLSRPLPTERAGAAVIKHGREILVLAGESLNGNHNEVEALDVINGTWRILPPLVQKRNAPGGASFQNRLFVTVGAPEPQSANQEFLDLDPLPFPDGGVPITGNTGTDPGDIGDQAGLLGAYYSGQNFATLKFERVDAGVNFSWGNNGPDAAQLTNDNFSIRWTGHVTIPATGSYTFYTQTDDGVRLWLDDELLIEDWESQPTSENSTTLFLQQDQVVSIKMEYFENGGGAVAKLLWSGPLFAKTAIPASYLSTVGPGGTPDPDPDPQPDPDPDPQPDPDPEPDPDPQPDPDPDPDPTPMDNGLLGTYFSTIDLSGTPVTRVDPVVDFNWGGGGPTNLTVTDNFSIRWTGFVTIPETGDYTFTTTTDDGVRLWLNDVLMINDWQSQPPTENPATLSLVQGQVVAIKMEYYEKGAGAVASLKWSGPGISKSIIPTQYLTTTDPGTGVDPTPDPDPDPQPDPDPHPTLENGFAGSYFANQTLTGVPLQQLDPVIHFDWGGGRPAILPSNDNFSIRWEGSIVIPAAGAYKLHTITDDGVRLFVNGNLVINDWKLHAPKQNTYSFTGQENQILNVVMEFFESGGGAVAKMEWEGPGISRGTVPAEQVFQNQASAEAYLNPPATSSYTSISQPGSSSSGSTTDQTTVATPGLYTLLLPLPDSLVDNGDGFGTLVVNNDLSGSLSLTMPDASSFTQDVQVTAEGIVINTTNGTGDQLTGTLIWRDLTGVSDLDGELTWTLQSLSNPITIVLIGSTYTEGTLESLLGSSAKLALAGSGVNQTLDVTISGNSVSATGEVNMGTFDPATGSFSWALNSFTVEGVFYEDQSLIGGYFHDGATQTGQMQIRPPSP